MKSNPTAVALIVMGALVILGPVLSQSANKENVAEYYRRNSPGVRLPEAMQPAGSGSYAWACWLAGAGMVFAGVRLNRAETTPRNA